ncbi:kelch repeat and BTB domain-containing protein 3 [Danio aesculapii]|uniref:kelch repeat and BTB domain-containing protein 3 n=1 Tax=Danio aesculapii TaxID=1142201 RepID=UPI0024C039B5|nr:kelch repeat and BTB domain-containing protein 3 [Danio aesculapii]
MAVSAQRCVFLQCECVGQQIISVLQGFRQRNLLLDFSIHVQDETLLCHRCVLAACSHFFRAMFELDMRECVDGSVTLSSLSAQAVHTFLDFAYSGEIEIREDNVEMLFQMASFLQVDFLLRACSDFLLESLDVSNCLHLLALAEGYGSTQLLCGAIDFITQNFQTVSCSAEFLELPASVLERVLLSDELRVPDEETVLQALLCWVKHDLSTRTSLMQQLLACVRLHHIPTATLEDAARSEVLTDECRNMLTHALAQTQQFSGLFTDARVSTTSTYIFVHKTEESMRHAFCYEIASDRWTVLPEDAMRIFELPGSVLTSFAEKLFITGGCHSECPRSIRTHISSPHHEATDEFWCYCPIARSFTPALRMRHTRTMHTCVVALQRMYVIGGKPRGLRDVPSILDVEYFDPLMREWISVSPLPKGIYFPEASACGDVIYALGSEVEISDAFNPLLDCFFRYDAVADQWSHLVAEFGQFFHARLVQSVCVNETLYLCDLSSYKVYSFCADAGVWRGEGSFECAGFNAAAVGVRGKIFILGGDYSPDEVSDEVQVYDSSRSEWQEVSPMPRALTEFHCQVLNFSRYRDPWRTDSAEHSSATGGAEE